MPYRNAELLNLLKQVIADDAKKQHAELIEFVGTETTRLHTYLTQIMSNQKQYNVEADFRSWNFYQETGNFGIIPFKLYQITDRVFLLTHFIHEELEHEDTENEKVELMNIWVFNADFHDLELDMTPTDLPDIYEIIHLDKYYNGDNGASIHTSELDNQQDTRAYTIDLFKVIVAMHEMVY